MPSSLASYGNGPPPLKPKPLHLTVSYRPHYERKVAQTSYQASSGSVRLLIPTEWALEGSNGLDVAALGPLAGDHYNDDGWAASNDGRIPSVYNTARTSTPESSLLPGKRTSIYFNPHQPNPFHAPLNAGEQSTVNHTAASSDLRDDDTPIMIDLPDSDRALRARAIHDFSGEGDFGELSFTRGTILAIEAEDVGGGWSAGFIVTGEATSGETVAASSGNIERGLIPTGFYALLPAQLPAGTAVALNSIGDITNKASYVDSPCAPQAVDKPDKWPSSDAMSHLATDISMLDDVTAQTHESATEQALQSSSYATRSLSRNVIISGIEFKPTTSPPCVETAQVSPPVLSSNGPKSFRPEMPAPLPRPPSSYFAARNAHWPESDVGANTDDCITANATEQCAVAFDWRQAFNIADGTATPTAEEIEMLLADFSIGARRRDCDDDEGTASPSDAFNEPEEPKSQQLGQQSSKIRQEASTSPDAERCRDDRDLITSQDVRASGSDQAQAIHQASFHTIEQSDNWQAVQPGLPSEPSFISRLTAQVGLGAYADSLPSRAPSVVWASRPVSSLARRLSALRGKGRHHALLEWLHAFENLGEGSDINELGRLNVDDGPAWRDEGPAFRISMSSPELHREFSIRGSSTQFIVYTLTTRIEGSDEPFSSVTRRYSQFVALHSRLTRQFPSPGLIIIPDLPTRYLNTSREGEEVALEIRRRDLERWCSRVIRHPVLKASDELRGFLTIESDKELADLLPLDSSPSATDQVATFLRSVFHPAFNIDMNDARELGEAFELHCRAMELGEGFKRVEEAIQAERKSLMAQAESERRTAKTWARLVAGHALPAAGVFGFPATVQGRNEGGRPEQMARTWHVLASDGALSAREGDVEALSMSKAVQATAESIHAASHVASSTVNDGLLSAQELLRELAFPLSHYRELIATHQFALAEYERLGTATDDCVASQSANSDALARCETLLNVTCAEMNRVLSERRDDLRLVTELYLSAQIERHQKTLEHLAFAKSYFSSDAFDALGLTGPRLDPSFDLLRDAQPLPRPIVMQPSLYGVPTSHIPTSSYVSDALGNAISLTRRVSVQRSLTVSNEPDQIENVGYSSEA